MTIHDVIAISPIRLQELLEVAQYTMIYFLVALFFGEIIDKIFPIDTKETAKKRSNGSLLILITLQIGLDAICIFYIHKIIFLFPFLFQFTKDYVPNAVGHASIGGVIAIALAFIGIQPSAKIRIDELARRLERFPHLLKF